MIMTNICLIFGYCATIGVDVNTLTNPPNGNWVVLANGSWNEWGWGVQLLDEDGDGLYIGTLCDLSDGGFYLSNSLFLLWFKTDIVLPAYINFCGS